MSKKIILDTDPGIDDSMAILFAEAHPDIDLIGLSICYGNATIENGTRNGLFLKDKFNLSCDVAKGAKEPLKRPPVGATVIVHGESGLGDVNPPEEIPNQKPHPLPAHEYIIDKIRANPHEITLVAVGPLTNLANVVLKDPDVTKLVKEVVVMGGAFGMNGHRGNVAPFSEANIYDDPHAADLVFCADWPIVIIGLDVTQQSFFSNKYFGELRESAGEVGQFIWDISRYYVDFYARNVHVDGCHVHDPSAIAYVINPDLFTLRKGPVRVICEGVAMGMTIQKFDDRRHPHDDWSTQPVQRVGVEVKNEELLKLYRTTLNAYEVRRQSPKV